ncbi:MAG: AMP-binding protein [Dermabacter sp.]|nr:AMP-binding protein [Dermabacter sp.]
MHEHPWSHFHADVADGALVTDDVSLPEAFDRAVSLFGSRTALEMSGKELTYAQLGHKVKVLAQGLLDTGVRPGDRVAIVLPMSIEAVIAFHATLRIGAVAVQHSANAPMAQLAKFFHDYRPECAIIADYRLDALGGIDRESAPRSVIAVPRPDEPLEFSRVALTESLVSLAKSSGRTLVRTAVGGSATPPAATRVNWVKWRDVMASPVITSEHPYPRPGDLATLIYAQRGPAAPLGAMLTHGNLHALAAQSLSWLEDSEPGTEVSYTLWPLHSVTGIANTLTTGLVHGRRNILFPRFSRSALLKALKKHPPTVVAADDDVFDFFAELAHEGNTQVCGIRFAFTRLTPREGGVRRPWDEALGFPIVVGYGTAESCVVSGLPLRAAGHEHTVGVPFPSTHVRVVDPAHRGRVLEAGEVGRLMIQGPQVFHGYWNKPDDTLAVLSGDGWLLTKEYATIDADGFVTLVPSPEPAERTRA